MLSRIAAVVAAVVLIAAAFAYRDRNDNVEAGGGTGGRVRLYCATEVTDVCESAVAGKNVELHVEPAGLTFDRIVNAATSAAAGVDVWVAPAPYPTMAAEARQRKAATDITGTPRKIGGARLALVVWKDRQAVMAKACSGTITWKCIGEIAGKGAWTASGGRAEWGLVKAGIPDPAVEKARAPRLIQGELPSPLSPPTGCVFHTRCPLASIECRGEIPALRDVRPGHAVACIKV